jgi:hypothetical protein
MKKILPDKIQLKFRINHWQWLVALLILTFIGWLPTAFPGSRLVDTVDWDMFAAFYESVRKNIIDYGQFPYWNPWHFGGTPLFARPQMTIFGIETIFVLMFGAINGLRWAMVFYALLGSAGMWLMLGDFVKNPTARFWGSMVFAMQGALACHIAFGHPMMTAVFFTPYLVYFMRRLTTSLRAALLFGTISAMMINQSLHYVSLTVAAFIGIYMLILTFKNLKNKIYLINLSAATLLFMSLCSYRLILTLHLLSEFPRKIEMRADVSVWNFVVALIYPGQSLFTFPGPLKLYWGWFEIACYAGLFTMIMFFISLWRELKWWHGGAVITALLTINSSAKWLPGYWVRELPAFNSFFCITRWRMLMMFFLALGCARGVDWLIRAKLPKKWRRVVPILLFISILGFQWNLYINWRDCNYITEAEMMATTKGNIGTGIKTVDQNSYKRYASVRNNLGQIFAYEPLYGYSFNKFNARLAAGNPAYGGEFYPAKGKIKAVDWSPNQINIVTTPNTVVLINQNPGNYWRDANNNKLFPKMRAFEVKPMFFAKSGNKQQINLQLLPPLHEAALYTNAISAILFLLLILYLKRKAKESTA